MAQEVCPACGGYRGSDYHSCYRCNGTGYIDVADSGSSSSSGISDDVYRDRSSGSSSSSSYSSSGSRRDSAAEAEAKATMEAIASTQARNDRIITDLYEKGNWKAIAKINMYGNSDSDFSTKACLMQAIAMAHLGDFDNAFEWTAASEKYNWGESEKESVRVLCLELFRIVQQAWEKKNKRAMTAADFNNFNISAYERYLDARYLSAIGYLLYNAKDYPLAVGFWQLAADKGDADAMNNVGFCYEKGQGVPQDKAKALEWYKRLEAVDSERGKKAIANLQNPSNQSEALITQGFTAYNAKDYAKAVELFRKAADMGNAKAMNNLGICYQNGQGVTKDINKAIEWFKKAAENGHLGAMDGLGCIYRDGEGVKQNFAEAEKWLKKAIAGGRKEAEPELAKLKQMRGK